MTDRFIFETILFVNYKKNSTLCGVLLTLINYLSVSNNAATNDFAENGRKSSIFSPTPI